MISHKHKFIFIHIPKTGGTSIEEVLCDESCQLLAGEWDYTRSRHAPLNHLTLQELADCGLITPTQLNSYFKFCFVRNPWDRLISEISCRWMSPWFKDMAMEQRIRYACVQAAEPTGIGNHLRPQCDFVTATGLQMDFIGRFEHLDEDFAKVCQMLGIKTTALPYRNRSEHQPYQEYYDAENQALVATTYRRDIETFHYTFTAKPSHRVVVAAVQPPVAQPVNPSTDKSIITAYPLHDQPAPWQPVDASAAPTNLVPVVSAAWHLCCPVGFRACWNGGPKAEDIEIHLATESDSQPAFVQSHMGQGLLTFYPGYQCQTSGGQHLWVRGPFHAPKDGLAPLESLIEAALLPSTIAIHWQFTRPHQTIHFATGEPFATVLLYPAWGSNTMQVNVVAPETNADAYSTALQQLHHAPEIQQLFQRLSAGASPPSQPEPQRSGG
jgi:hypothetical protein